MKKLLFMCLFGLMSLMTFAQPFPTTPYPNDWRVKSTVATVIGNGSTWGDPSKIYLTVDKAQACCTGCIAPSIPAHTFKLTFERVSGTENPVIVIAGQTVSWTGNIGTHLNAITSTSIVFSSTCNDGYLSAESLAGSIAATATSNVTLRVYLKEYNGSSCWYGTNAYIYHYPGTGDSHYATINITAP